MELLTASLPISALPEKFRRGKRYKDAPADAAFYFNDKIVRYTLGTLG